LQLVVAITAQRPEHLAGEALRMDAHERSAVGQIAEDQCERSIRVSRAVHNHALKRHGLKHSPFGGHPGGGDSSDCQGLCHGCHAASSCVSKPHAEDTARFLAVPPHLLNREKPMLPSPAPSTS